MVYIILLQKGDKTFMRRAINILWIALIYCGTIFGAGFASGQEVFQFFSRQGFAGIITSVFVGFLFSFFGGVICFCVKKGKMKNAKMYISSLFSPWVAKVVSVISHVFLVVTFCIMIAGCGALAQQWSLRPIVGAVCAAVLCYFVIRNQEKGLASLNSVITPFLFIGVVLFCILIQNSGAISYTTVPCGNVGKAVWFGVLYLSYNMIPAVAALVSATKLAETEKDAMLGGVLGGILVALPLILMTICLCGFKDAAGEQLPFFVLTYQSQEHATFFCGALLFGAMLTTAASSGVSLLESIHSEESMVGAFLLCTLSVLVSVVPFNILVKTAYTGFGVCGLVLTIGILRSLKRK